MFTLVLPRKGPVLLPPFRWPAVVSGKTGKWLANCSVGGRPALPSGFEHVRELYKRFAGHPFFNDWRR